MMMHFGKIVKKVAHSRDLSAVELAEQMGRTTREVLFLYEDEEWKTGDVIAASEALNYDFGHYLNRSRDVKVLNQKDEDGQHEIIIRLKYQRGKEVLLKTWLNKVLMIARSIGLEIQR